MKRWLLLLFIVVMSVGLLAGCAPKQWSTFEDFIADFQDAPDPNTVKGLLSGYKVNQTSAEVAENFTFENLKVWNSEWEGHIYSSTDEYMSNVGVGLWKGFEKQEDRDAFYKSVSDQLTAEFGEGNPVYDDDGNEGLEWSINDNNLRLSQYQAENKYTVAINYMSYVSKSMD